MGAYLETPYHVQESGRVVVVDNEVVVHKVRTEREMDAIEEPGEMRVSRIAHMRKWTMQGSAWTIGSRQNARYDGRCVVFQWWRCTQHCTMRLHQTKAKAR